MNKWCSLNRWFHSKFSDLSFFAKNGVSSCVRVHFANIQINADEIRDILIGIELIQSNQIKSNRISIIFHQHFIHIFYFLQRLFFMFSSCAFNLFSNFWLITSELSSFHKFFVSSSFSSLSRFFYSLRIECHKRWQHRTRQMNQKKREKTRK